MPKVYLTIKERRQAEADRQFKMQNIMLSALIKETIKHKLTYEELAEAAGVSKTTILKALNNPASMKVEMLQKICFAAGIKLEISAAAELGA